MSVLIVLVLVALLVAAIAALQGGQLHSPLRYRSCQSRLWRRAFPTASRKEIREFLSLVVSTFSFTDTDRLRIRPDDEVLGISAPLTRTAVPPRPAKSKPWRKPCAAAMA